MVSAIIAAGVVTAWLAIVVLVRHDSGDVGVTDLQRAMLRLRGGFHLMSLAFADAMLPIVRKTTKAMVEFNEAMERARG